MSRKFEVSLRRKDLRDRAVAHLGGQCCICGYSGCAAAFDFHHTNPLEKDFAISSRMTSWDRIAPELVKCILLCARCHREVHDGWHSGFLVIDDRGAPEGGGFSRQLLLF
jgi:hypothetical protein